MKDTMCGLVKEVNAPSGLVYHTDLPIPEINDDEVLIKVHCSAICGTDLHIMEWDEWSQKRIKAPVTVGHETAGEIVAVGTPEEVARCEKSYTGQYLKKVLEK